MKTSNYIIMAFLIFLFGGILTLFVSAKLDPRAGQNQKFETLEKPLDPFSVIVAEPGASFQIKTGETTRLSTNYQKGEEAILPSYVVRNDTLFVSAFPKSEKRTNLEVCYTKIRSIEGKANSEITAHQISGDSLTIKLNDAHFRHYSRTKTSNAALQIIANNSNVQLGDISIENLDIQLNKTEMNVWNSSIVNLSGTLTESSSLSMGQISKINVEVDSSSNYHLNK